MNLICLQYSNQAICQSDQSSEHVWGQAVYSSERQRGGDDGLAAWPRAGDRCDQEHNWSNGLAQKRAAEGKKHLIECIHRLKLIFWPGFNLHINYFHLNRCLILTAKSLMISLYPMYWCMTKGQVYHLWIGIRNWIKGIVMKLT